MSFQHLTTIDLPPHAGPGGFDHAAVHSGRALLYVAHTANNALDVLDCAHDRYVRSMPGLTGVAGALVAEEQDFVFTSNRGEDTVGIFRPDHPEGLVKITVGVRPNGLAYASEYHLLLVANVGDPAVAGSHTVSLVDVRKQMLVAEVTVPGRTRWTIYDASTDSFYVNIAAPAQIVVINASAPRTVARVWEISAAGPHGLDLDEPTGRLFCACDGKKLVTLATPTGAVLEDTDIGGVPDVIFFNAALRRIYVAIGDPGIIEVFDTDGLRRIETVVTEPGAHTLGLDASRNKIYAFLPQTHRAAVYADQA